MPNTGSNLGDKMRCSHFAESLVYDGNHVLLPVLRGCKAPLGAHTVKVAVLTPKVHEEQMRRRYQVLYWLQEKRA